MRSGVAPSHGGGGVRLGARTGCTVRRRWRAAARSSAPKRPAGRARPPCASSQASTAGIAIRAISSGPMAFRRRASTDARDGSFAARFASSKVGPTTHAAASASLPSLPHCAPITSGWVVDPIRPCVQMQAQRVHHSLWEPRLRHTAIAAGVSPLAPSSSMSHTRLPGNGALRSTASGTAYSASRRRVTLNATMGSSCVGASQCASSGASRGPSSARHRMAPSSAMLRCASWLMRSAGKGCASSPPARVAPRGRRPCSTPRPSVRPRLPGAAAGASPVQHAPAPKPMTARTKASKAPPVSWRRLLRAFGPALPRARTRLRTPRRRRSPPAPTSRGRTHAA